VASGAMSRFGGRAAGVPSACSRSSGSLGATRRQSRHRHRRKALSRKDRPRSQKFFTDWHQGSPRKKSVSTLKLHPTHVLCELSNKYISEKERSCLAFD
jgi:uncharacterized Zn-finger protein